MNNLSNMKITKPNFDGKNIFPEDKNESNGNRNPVHDGQDLRLDENRDDLIKKQPIENLERGFIMTPHEDEHKDDYAKDEESDLVDFEEIKKPDMRIKNSTMPADDNQNKEHIINPLNNIF